MGSRPGSKFGSFAELYARQGLPVPDKEEYEKARLARRQWNVIRARKVLTEFGIQWTEWERGEPLHSFMSRVVFHVQVPGQLPIKFEAETGDWIATDVGQQYGIKNLARYIRSMGK